MTPGAHLICECLCQVVGTNLPTTWMHTISALKPSCSSTTGLTTDVEIYLTESLGQGRRRSIILHVVPLHELIQIFILRGGDILRQSMESKLFGLRDTFDLGFKVVNMRSWISDKVDRGTESKAGVSWHQIDSQG